MTTRELCEHCNGTGVLVQQGTFTPAFDYERWRFWVTEAEIDRAIKVHGAWGTKSREKTRYNIALGKSIGTYPR